ncbi:aminotransferase class I/II-fold pyridoxal phosphate-dependent enzyme [Streptomyces sp. NBC_01264]|uniref:aminotransferase class I/II-fold pyridoxal phosphate-dependent enzyme n=1 Tax=Streptomyces sp. NBC_01264 TaxID=2903804 RepID=UPI00225976C8|nr:aminotransferase class I/II-fold pyridoxal phosphate-dependent enzyme [Streptomyces sp. NBC_01264]MCX4781829.1 aminotransferase class I/II-fold pyridoxal phosphate-dependent enzyme [Streptomyces sp. NBC_01264]
MTLHTAIDCDVCIKSTVMEAVGNPYYPQVTAKESNRIDFDGVPALLAAGNDYLDLSTDPRVQQAAHDAIDRYGVSAPVPGDSLRDGEKPLRRAAHDAIDLYGVGMCGSPLMNGYLAIHQDLEAEIAAWTGQEAALLFTAEDLALVGPMAQLVLLNRDTAVLAEDSVPDRVLGGTQVVQPRWTQRFRHNDLEGLRELLAETAERTGHILLVVEATGTGTPASLALTSICKLAREFGAEIFMYDPDGIVSRDGAAALLGHSGHVDYLVGTLSGAFGSSGAYLATSREMARHLIAQCSTRMFAAALPPFLTAAARAALSARRLAPGRGATCAAPEPRHGFIDRGIDSSRWDDYRTMRSTLGRELAQWAGKEDGIVFTAGYLSNLHGLAGVIRMNQDVTVITDRSSHASMTDGIRLGGPRRSVRFHHNDLDDLRLKLTEAKERTARAIILVEGAYSVEGDLAALPEIVSLAREFGAEIFLDGAHGVGVTGGGRGTAAGFGLARDVDYITGTFSKAFGATGGFLLASAEVIAALDTFAPDDPAITLAPALIAAAQRALDIMKAEPHRAAHAHAMGDNLRRELSLAGFEPQGTTPIVSLSLNGMFRSAESPEVRAITHENPRRQALERAKARIQRDSLCTVRAHNWLLSQRGVYTNAFIAPGVDEPLLRLSTTAAFTEADVMTIVDAFVDLREAYRNHGAVPDAPAAGLALPVS